MNTTLWRLANGPQFTATRYTYGFVFSSNSKDDCLVPQDSGISMRAITTFRESGKDTNPKEAMTTYYGVKRDIIEFNYMDFKHTVFYCDWVRVEDKTNGCKVDPY
ncbi:hypothetical protein BVC80_1305g5 [Macleaya cordata]|uniref:Uncharacterized protein n=1 Tax=Macleaya cordata TaxID=56857 RepID=A0A200R371_MACCD|nr:hypothetical protein BVC80_1305g5 [Macleaya cordata]